MRIFIAGGTGLVGSRLIARLLERGDQVKLLTRRPEVAREKWGERCAIVAGDPMKREGWLDELKDCEGVVNLVGEGIFNRRWSADFKELLRSSRVQSTANIVAALAGSQVKVLVNASAIGYYGPTGDEELTESSPAGNDFLAQLCIDWEKAAQGAAAHGVRLTIVRVGVVLDPHGGALRQLLTPFKMFMGGKVGSGRQYLSWIHHADLVGLICLAFDREAASGSLNGVAPHPVTNKQFAKALGRALSRPSFMPTPRFMIRVILGEVADVITTGQRVLPRKALDLGYPFQFPDLDGALQSLFAS